MPAPGDVNNPQGSNGTQVFDGFAQESAYGAIKREQQTTQAAPVVTPSGNAARRAQRRAVRPTAAQPAPPPAPMLPQPAAMTFGSQNAARWQQIAAIPGASPLVLELAAAAQQYAG